MRRLCGSHGFASGQPAALRLPDDSRRQRSVRQPVCRSNRRTPVRVSFCGGGTDLAAFYRNHSDGGLVTSLTLDAYIYVTVNRRFDDSVRISYSQTEIVDDFEDLQHELVREAMRMTGVTSGVEVTTIADIPARGTGLGSSSTVTVGLLHALYALAGEEVSAERLAREACEIEIDVLGQTIGKQDQYAAAFGGVNQIAFNADDTVTVTPLSLAEDTLESLKGILGIQSGLDRTEPTGDSDIGTAGEQHRRANGTTRGDAWSGKFSC